ALLGVLGAGCLAWLTHPLLPAALLPLFVLYYVRVGARHGLAWHSALLGGLAGAVALNAFWLLDWLQLAWIREPLRGEGTGGTGRRASASAAWRCPPCCSPPRWPPTPWPPPWTACRRASACPWRPWPWPPWRHRRGCRRNGAATGPSASASRRRCASAWTSGRG